MMSNYPKDFSDEQLREVARQWDDDGADGETVHALTNELIRLRTATRVDREKMRTTITELHHSRDLNNLANGVLLKMLEE